MQESLAARLTCLLQMVEDVKCQSPSASSYLEDLEALLARLPVLLQDVGRNGLSIVRGEDFTRRQPRDLSGNNTLG